MSATIRPSPDDILAVVCKLSGIPLDALKSPSQLRKLGPARAAAAHLLRAQGGLSVEQVAPLLGRSGQTISEFSRNARLALGLGGTIAVLISEAKQLLDASARIVPSAPPQPGSKLERTSRQSPARALPLPHLTRWRARSRRSAAQLAERSGVPARTITRIERGWPARPDIILRLADALVLAPSELTGTTDLDPLTGEIYRRCKSCDALRPVRGFVPLKNTPYVYLRCRACRARRARERYQSDPQERAAQIRRAQRNRLKRRQAAA